MSRVIDTLSRHLGETLFSVLPSIPYAQKEKAGCPGIAVATKQLSAAARLDGPTAFADATFEIPCGCRTALIGPNGSGKSTLLRVLAGLTPICSGEALVAGESPRLGRSRIAYLAQRPHLAELFPLKLRRLVQMGTYAHHGWFEECQHGDEAIDLALTRLGLTGLAERPIHTLSGGQLQRALIARAVVQGAELLLLDEPYAALDQASREIVDRFLFEQGHAFTVVMATHDPADLGRFDRILEMRDGTIITRHACTGHDHRHA
jgi:ABC-type Mn2+/Zn2+ transport system ATPase subunit